VDGLTETVNTFVKVSSLSLELKTSQLLSNILPSRSERLPAVANNVSNMLDNTELKMLLCTCTKVEGI
jgi:hypothetical protein